MKTAESLRSRLGANMRESVGVGSGATADAPQAADQATAFRSGTQRHDGAVRMRDALSIDLARITPDPDQPRREFDPQALADLAASVKARGILQPLLVRWDEPAARWTIITGERRYRAAMMAGLSAVPCVEYKGPIDASDRLEVQLIENALRADLTPIEQATAFRALLDRREWTYRDLAANLHIALSSVARALALLDLPTVVQEQVERGEVPATTAAELAKIADPATQAEVAAAAVAGKLTRSEVAEVVQAVRSRRPSPPPRPDPVTLDLGDGVTITVRWKRAGPVSLVQALRRALKLAQEQRRDDEAA
jgi:ParB family chromosome partitioning protein